MRKVNSSAIEAIAYNPFWVTVKFNHGKKYRYWGVTYKTYRLFKNAESIGKAYNTLIKGKYRSEAVPV